MSLLEYVLLLTAALCCTAAPAADDSCPRPERLAEAELQGDWDKDSYPKYTEAVYLCRPGFSRLGSLKMNCLNGKWTYIHPKGQCRKKSCGHPGDIQFGSFNLKNEESFIFGAVVDYYCDDGYRMVSKEKTRQCTASGWSNYPPHCEVKNCPPVDVAENINVLSTSYDEEYSVGQVVRFECKNKNLKLNGPSEIFCTSEGGWNLEPPACVDISCNQPLVDNGRVNNPKKNGYTNNEVIQITCNEGFRASKNGEAKCTKDDWLPTPTCNEIVCSPYYPVEKGKLVAKKLIYKYNDEIDVECDDGHMLQVEPNKRRVCTSNEWYPPARCVSKKCDRPDIKHGLIDYDYYYPKDVGRYLYYRCERNFIPYDWKIIHCTNNGWNPKPKCLRQCSSSKADLENAYLQNKQSTYVEGATVKFKCNYNYQTPEGQDGGERTCLPNGEFTPAKCSRTCKAPQLLDGEFYPITNEFDIGEYLQYKCNKGYVTSSGTLVSKAQCLNGGWSEIPSCTAITCKHNNLSYKDGDVLAYTCPYGQKPASEAAQCYHFGWGPQINCKDIECTVPVTLNLIKSPHKPSYKIDHEVSFSCKEGFGRVGSLESICTEQGWNPSLPTCQEEKPVKPDTTDVNEKQVEIPLDPDSVAPDSKNKTEKREGKCPPAYSPKNAEIKDPREAYYSNDNVTMTCVSGFKMYGSPIIRCVEGKWEQPPECIRSTPCRNPPPIKNGGIVESSKKQEYVTDDVVKYICKSGFHFSGSDQTTCVSGQWSASLICTEDSCAEAPEVTHATALQNKKTFVHGEKAKYECDNGFRFSEEDSASCVEGKWLNTPKCVETSCKSPPPVANSRINRVKASYASGEKCTYVCNSGYSLEISMKGDAICENTQWINLPVCRKIGEQCGPPPTVQSGDTVQIREQNYKSGESVEFRCPEYYILKGNRIVKCLNGVWDVAPVCLEPCTAKEKDMEENNIQLRWKGEKKLYSKHGERIEYACKNGFNAPANTQMAFFCEHGKLEYPKCFKTGFCALEQLTMITNNIFYNISTVVDHGQTIVFQCNEGMIPENKLEVKCVQGNINYPKCTASRSCKTPKILNGLIKDEQQASYDSGSYVEFECNKEYVIHGPIIVKCENGQWTDLPVCQSSCKISSEDLAKGNIELQSSDNLKNILDKNYKHGTELSVTCKTGFRRPNQASLVIECYDGKFSYTRCFSGKTCRIDQDYVDENNLELDEVHNNEVYYEEGENITFKCKNGYHRRTKPAGKCVGQKITYPKCTESSV
ncbi:complement factor H [Rhinoderma darwinii]|uniref:complement factor H n=1 Tax=Rhinoderma darwinii TaxID=43563 RepID=UPI003F673B00